jgi:hypothetical protein
VVCGGSDPARDEQTDPKAQGVSVYRHTQAQSSELTAVASQIVQNKPTAQYVRCLCGRRRQNPDAEQQPPLGSTASALLATATGQHQKTESRWCGGALIRI